MITSTMAANIDRYMVDDALFSSDLQAKLLKWKTNYSFPLATGYHNAKTALDNCISEAKSRAEQRHRRLEELAAKVEFAMGIALALLGPFSEAATTGLKESLRITEQNFDTRVLTKWYGKFEGTGSFDNLMDRERVRQYLLNYVSDRAVTILKDRVSAALGKPISVPPATTSSNAAFENITGEYDSARFQQCVQNVFDSHAVELLDAHQRVRNIPELKREFLQVATKTTLVTPPPKPISEVIPAAVLKGSIFAMISANLLMGAKTIAGMAWPNVGVDLAYTINTQLSELGQSIITNNPQPGVRQVFPPGMDRQMAWDGHIAPYTLKKLQTIAQGGAAVLETYMAAINSGNDIT